MSFDHRGLVLPVKGPVFADRLTYVIAPDGKILYAYSDASAQNHIVNALAVVRKWRESQAK
jgi:peroxiredoxin